LNEFTKLSVLLAEQVLFLRRVGVDSGPSADGTVIIHFLVGRLAEGVLSGWLALVGIGRTIVIIDVIHGVSFRVEEWLCKPSALYARKTASANL
jgi:hypothetical protein